jgi:arylsulfatase A-like enzyme
MSSKPNVIVFFSDQQRWDTSSLFGNPMNLTPNYDRMALEGTHCYNAFTPQPVCVPARMVMQTGQYASKLDTYSNNGELLENQETIGHLFKNAGYNTAYIGKWHMCHEEPVPKERRTGYDYWLGSNILEFTSDAYQTTMFDNDGNPVELPGFRADAVADSAIKYINEHKGSPFFMFCSFIEPHFQNSRDDYPAPTGYEQKYIDPWVPPDLRNLVGTAPQHLPGYYGMVKRLDEAFGRMLDALRSLKLLDNTIILYTSDHGCHFKTRNREYKRSCHDSSIRIPMAFQGPGFQAGGRLPEMVSLVDIPPTLLDAADIDIPDYMQGRSILPLTKERVTDWPEEIFSEICDRTVERCVRTKRWKYSVMKTDISKNRGSNWEFKEDSMYDLLADPYELNNLVGSIAHRGVADVMKKRLIRRMKEAGEDKPVILDAEKCKGGQKKIAESEMYE